MSNHTIYYLNTIFYAQKSSNQGQDSEGLPPQPDSTSSTVTSMQLPTSKSATGQQKQTKLGKLFVTMSCAFTLLWERC